VTGEKLKVPLGSAAIATRVMEQLARVNFLPITFDTDPPDSICVVYPKIEYPQITQINADFGF
jgi:hypothetical protein